MDNNNESNMNNNCGINTFAMAYFKPQSFENLYDADIGFGRGTIFEALDFPFMGRSVVNEKG